jgi:hypothetical protein
MNETTTIIANAHPAQPLVKRLQDRGYTPSQIAVFMNDRVSERTVYRWGKGGSDPQNPADLRALQNLADRLAPVIEMESAKAAG